MRGRRNALGCGGRTARRLSLLLVLCSVAGFSSLSPACAQAPCGSRLPPSPIPAKFSSTHLEHEITVLPGVFFPLEAARNVLPLMKTNAELFPGKSVLEIGVGSGIISLYAASLGARRVVSTDINPAALETTRRNAAELGFADRIETRLVPESDISAYSVIRPDERFDVILSNPPYSLDLDVAANDACTDRGDLGFSIVRGLDDHLAPGGIAIMLYNSSFYHNAMVEFARYRGHQVRNHHPIGLTSTETRVLFNSYLARLLEREGVEPDAFRFDGHEGPPLRSLFLRNRVLLQEHIDYEPLLPGDEEYRPGLMVIER